MVTLEPHKKLMRMTMAECIASSFLVKCMVIRSSQKCKLVRPQSNRKTFVSRRSLATFLGDAAGFTSAPSAAFIIVPGMEHRGALSDRAKAALRSQSKGSK